MSDPFTHKRLSATADEIAPDGSEVRHLVNMAAGGMAHFTIPAGHTIRAVRHRTVDEIWYFVSGRGEMWRSFEGREEVIDVQRDLAVSIPAGTVFQVRSLGDEPLCVIGQTMPPWPGKGEAVMCAGPWTATL